MLDEIAVGGKRPRLHVKVPDDPNGRNAWPGLAIARVRGHPIPRVETLGWPPMSLRDSLRDN
jgi:hypothetical protein